MASMSWHIKSAVLTLHVICMCSNHTFSATKWSNSGHSIIHQSLTCRGKPSMLFRYERNLRVQLICCSIDCEIVTALKSSVEESQRCTLGSRYRVIRWIPRELLDSIYRLSQGFNTADHTSLQQITWQSHQWLVKEDSLVYFIHRFPLAFKEARWICACIWFIISIYLYWCQNGQILGRVYNNDLFMFNTVTLDGEFDAFSSLVLLFLVLRNGNLPL